MVETLAAIGCRYAESNADGFGVTRTPIQGLAIVRDPMPGALIHAVNRPLVALVLQGRKRVTFGTSTFDFGQGESLLITTDVPTVSQITQASAGKPYCSLVIDLDAAVIEDLVGEIGTAPFAAGEPIHVDATDREVADAALRLLRLLDRPAALAVLKDQLVRELHYWLLSGRHGAAIRCLGVANSHARRIGAAVATIRARYDQPLRTDELARLAGMSPSAFFAHFRAITSLTPLQFQKHLRLIEARRRMVSEGASARSAAFAVGYESASQFTREYGRLFGSPPGRDARAERRGELAA